MEKEGCNELFRIRSELEVHEYADKIVIRSVPNNHHQAAAIDGFSISRSDGTFHKFTAAGDGDDVNNNNLETTTSAASKVYPVFGVAGSIRLLAGSSLSLFFMHIIYLLDFIHFPSITNTTLYICFIRNISIAYYFSQGGRLLPRLPGLPCHVYQVSTLLSSFK